MDNINRNELFIYCKLFLKIGLCYLNLLGNRYYIVICGMKFNLYFLLDEYEFI